MVCLMHSGRFEGHEYWQMFVRKIPKILNDIVNCFDQNSMKNVDSVGFTLKFLSNELAW